MRPLISVIVRTYNRSHFLTEALESVFSQTFKDFEIVVVDDGSTDDTPEIMKRFSGRVIYIRQKKSGAAFALNNGIRHAAGDFIAFLDDDDLWEPEMLSQTYGAMIAHPNIAVVYSNYEFFRHPNKDRTMTISRRFYLGQIFEQLLKENNFITLDSVLLKKNCIEEVGMFDISLGAAQDWDLWLRISCKGFEFLHIDKLLLKIRLHQENLNRDLINLAKSQLYILQKIGRNPFCEKSKAKLLLPGLISQKRSFLGRALIKKELVKEGRQELSESLNSGGFARNLFSLFLMMLSFISPKAFLSLVIILFESILGKDKGRFYR